MSARHPLRNFWAAGLVPGCWAATLLLLVACESPQVDGKPSASGPLLQPAITAPDVRTEAAIIEMENRYIAEKNSQPTRQHQAEAEQRKKAEAAKQQEDRPAQEAKQAETAPVKPQ